LRHVIGRTGVSVHCAADTGAVRLILDRLSSMRAALRGVP
jgi:hypothetical protein